MRRRNVEPVRAASYDLLGPAADVLRVGVLPTSEPGPGEVRGRLTRSGVNPGDVKKRQGWLGSAMAFPRVVPHSDGAGAVEAVGDGLDLARLGRRVWVYGAQSYRACGTAAVPAGLAHYVVELADVTASIRGVAPDGVDRVVEVALSANADLDAAVLRNGGVMAAFAHVEGPHQDPLLALAVQQCHPAPAGQ